MFREVARKKNAISKEESIELLRNQKRGVLSLIGDEGYPYGMPLNHYYCEEDGKLYFHSGKVGHKIDAMMANEKASYCVLDDGYRPEGEWAYYFKSAVVFGRIEVIRDQEKIIDISRKLSLKFTDDRVYIEHEIAQSAKNTFMFALVPEHITGKRVHEA